jgi:hypothetical protein
MPAAPQDGSPPEPPATTLRPAAAAVVVSPLGADRPGARRAALGDWIAGPGWVAGTVGPVVAVLISLDLSRRAWGGRLVRGQDTTALATRAHVGITQIFLHGRLDGWLPDYGLGYREFLFNGPGFTALIGVVRLLTFGRLSDAGAVKVVAVASFAAFPLAVVFLARSLGLSRRAAGIGAVLSVAVSSPFGLGFQGVFETGLVPQQVALLLLCVAWGAALRTAAEPRARWTLLAAGAGAALAVTHLISVFILGAVLVLSLPCLWVTDPFRLRSVRHLVGGALLAGGLAGFWLVPALAHQGLHGPATTWATPALTDRVASIWRGQFLVGPDVAALLVVAMGAAVARAVRRRRYGTALLIVPVGFVALCRGAVHLLPHNPIAIQLENRGVGLVAVVAMLAVAVLLGWAARWAQVGDAIAIVAAAALVLASAGAWVDDPLQAGHPVAAATDAAAALRRLVPPGSRYVAVREYPHDQVVTRVLHPDLWLGWAAGRWSLNTFNIEASSTPDAGLLAEQMLHLPPDRVADLLENYGVSQVVTTSTGAFAHLAASARFTVSWSEPPLAILAVAPRPGHPEPASLLATDGPGQAQILHAGSQNLTLTAEVPAPTAATIAVAWSPNWRATVDGRHLTLRRGAHGLVALALPAGRHTIRMRYGSDGWDRLGLLLSLATLMGLLGWWRRRRRRARPPMQLHRRPGRRPARRSLQLVADGPQLGVEALGEGAPEVAGA